MAVDLLSDDVAIDKLGKLGNPGDGSRAVVCNILPHDQVSLFLY